MKILHQIGLLALLPALFLFKTKTYYEDDNRQNGRIKGSAIIISNHRTFWDGMVIAVRYFYKRLHFLNNDYYKGIKVILKPMVLLAGGILVSLDGQRMDFIEKCKRVTARGRSIMIFPEGGFQFTFEPARFSAGYIMLAIKNGAKILPIANDFNYGLFKRVSIMIGKSIDLSRYAGEELTKEKVNEINDDIRAQFIRLFYQLKRKKAEKIPAKYEFISPKKGDVIRIFTGAYYHYGVYLSAGEVIQFGNAVNRTGDKIVINTVSMKEFCGGKIPEARVIKKRYVRSTEDIEKYAKSRIGDGGYCIVSNNCLDFANRVTLKI